MHFCESYIEMLELFMRILINNFQRTEYNMNEKLFRFFFIKYFSFYIVLLFF